MGQSLSAEQRHGARSSKVKERVQLLEELVQGPSQGRRQELLRQITSDSSRGQSGYFLPSAPEEFKLGCLIAAGSYGRVYAGSYRGQPAALKLLLLDEESAAAIVNEVRLCLKLNHKNLVRLLDCAVVSTSHRASTSQDAESGWFSSPGPQPLQLFNSNLYSYLPVLSTPGMLEQQLQAGSSAVAGASTSVIARASDETQHGFITGNDLLYHEAAQQHHQLGLTSAAGHACFEVWIAMEYCDGGTLAEQVQQGFQYVPETNQVDMELLLKVAIDIARALLYMHTVHVCHGDLKSENVLLKSVGPASADGSSGCGGSTCWGSSDDCSWLGMLCSSASSSSSPSKCRRRSDDSCLSCCSWTTGCGSASVAGTAAAGRWHRPCLGASTSSSASSSPGSGGRQTDSSSGRDSRGNAVSRSLGRLCCMGTAAGACIGEDGDDDYQAVGSAAGASCLCGSCPGTLHDLDDAACVEAHSSPALGSPDLSPQLAEQEGGVQGLDSPASGHVSPMEQQHHDDGRLFSAPALLMQPAAGAEHSAAQQLALISALEAEQADYESWPRNKDNTGEEEHVAPLSLYNIAREQRRSRRLSQTALLPSMQAAIAAAAARMSTPAGQHGGRRSSTSNSIGAGNSIGTGDHSASSREENDDHCSNASTSDVAPEQPADQAGTVLLGIEPAAAAAAMGGAGLSSRTASRPRAASTSYGSSEGSSPSSALSSRAGNAAAAATAAGGTTVGCSMTTLPEGMPAVDHQQLLGRTLSGHDVYARWLPPRSRRHSYCYGASYASLISPGSTASAVAGRGYGVAQNSGIISAAEAATVIAATAEAMRDEWRSSRSSRSSRRMSCDERLLLQRRGAGSLVSPVLLHRGASGDGSSSNSNSAFGLVSGLGRPPAALRRTGSGSTNYMDAKAAAQQGVAAGRVVFGTTAAAAAARCRPDSSAGPAVPGRRQRRHSWTGFDVSLGEAGSLWSLRSLTSLLVPQEQQRQPSQLQSPEDEAAVWLLEGHDEQQELPSGLVRNGSGSSATATASAASERERRVSAVAAVGMVNAASSADATCCSMGLRGRARRHSWAGFGYEQMAEAAAAQAKRTALRALSSCFSPQDTDEYVRGWPGSDRVGRRHSCSAQSPRRPMSYLPACCGDVSCMPLEVQDAAPAGSEEGEARQPLLQSGCSTDSAHSGDSGTSSGILGEPCHVSVSCLGRVLGSGGGTKGRSNSGSSRSRRRSSWCCSGVSGASQGMAGDLSVAGSSSMAALLPPASFAPSSVPLMPAVAAHSGGSSSRWRGRASRRASWDEARHSSVYEETSAAAGAALIRSSELNLLEIQANSRGQQHSQSSLLAAVRLPGESGEVSLAARSAGAAAAGVEHADDSRCAANGAADAGNKVTKAVWEFLPLEESTAAGDSAASADQQSTQSSGGSPCAPVCNRRATQQAAQAARAQLSPATVTPATSGAHKLPLSVAPAAPKCGRVVAAAAPTTVACSTGRERRASRLSSALGSSTVMQVQAAEDPGSPAGQDLSVGYNMLFGPGTAAAAATGAGLAAPAAAPVGPHTNSSSSSLADMAAAPQGHGLCTPQRQQQQQPPLNLADAAAVAGAGVWASSSKADAPLERVSPMQLFTGSFDVGRKQQESNSRRNSSSSSSVLGAAERMQQQEQLQAASAAPAGCYGGGIQRASVGSRSPQATLSIASFSTASTAASAGSSKSRRWSTGVAAQDLVLRKQSLAPSPVSQFSDAFDGRVGSGSGPGSEASSTRCRVSVTSQGPDGSLAPSLSDWQELHACATSMAAARAAATVPVSPDRMGSLGISSCAGSALAGSPAPSAGGVSVMSSGSHQVVNVLGMPPRSSAVLNQRRLSYDTGTGAYHDVSKYKTPLQPLPQPQHTGSRDTPASLYEQEEQQQASAVKGQQLPEQPVAEQHEVGLLPMLSPQQQQLLPEQQQQQCQAHMQRLVEALAKKGYSTSLPAGGSAPLDNTLQQQAQHDEQQQCAGSPCLSLPAAGVPQQQQAVTSCAAAASAAPKLRYSAKVCDFGFSQCLRAGQSHCSTAVAGTITHQAPEVLKSGYLSPAADIYSFGIILWELLTGERPFRGLLEGDLVVGVCENGLRPVFPPGTPPAYVALAQQCWSQQPGDRPIAQQVLKRLNEMLYEVRRARGTQPQQCCPHCSDGSSQSRRRRHSMPAVGSARQRRLSRRLSLFMPFSRQPAAVPEHAPLEPQLVQDGELGARAGQAGGTAMAAAAGVALLSHGASSSGSFARTAASSASGHAVRLRSLQTGMVSGSGNASEAGRSTAANTAAAVASGAAYAVGVAADADGSSQWFESFDD